MLSSLLSLSVLLTSVFASPSPNESTISARSTFTSCLGSPSFKVLSPTDPDYNSASLAFNRRLTFHPAAVVYPNNGNDVSAITKCAVSSGLPVVSRSGGHSYAAYGLGGQDGAVVIDLSLIKQISIDSSGVSTVGTGNRLGDVAQYLWDHGRKALPHGTCPYVGTGGHTSYGGFGMFGRTQGLLLDKVVGADVVLANGTQVSVTAKNYPDLFWAIRGAAPSFAIVVQWKYQTVTGPNTINWHIKPTAKLSKTNAQKAFVALQNFAASNPTSKLSLVCPLGVSNGAVSLQFDGSFYGSLADLKTAIAPFQKALPGGTNSWKLTYKQFDWYGGLVDVTGPLSTSNPQSEIDNFFAKSLFVTSPLASSAYTSWVNFMLSSGVSSPVDWWVEIDMFGGVISKVAESATAYSHRNAILSFQFYAYTDVGKTFPSSGVTFLNNMVKSLNSNVQAAYPNYVDPTLTASQWHQQYFGSNYARLVKIKKSVDPQNIFRFPQSIPLS